MHEYYLRKNAPQCSQQINTEENMNTRVSCMTIGYNELIWFNDELWAEEVEFLKSAKWDLPIGFFSTSAVSGAWQFRINFFRKSICSFLNFITPSITCRDSIMLEERWYEFIFQNNWEGQCPPKRVSTIHELTLSPPGNYELVGLRVPHLFLFLLPNYPAKKGPRSALPLIKTRSSGYSREPAPIISWETISVFQTQYAPLSLSRNYVAGTLEIFAIITRKRATGSKETRYRHPWKLIQLLKHTAGTSRKSPIIGFKKKLFKFTAGKEKIYILRSGP